MRGAVVHPCDLGHLTIPGYEKIDILLKVKSIIIKLQLSTLNPVRKSKYSVCSILSMDFYQTRQKNIATGDDVSYTKFSVRPGTGDILDLP